MKRIVYIVSDPRDKDRLLELAGPLATAGFSVVHNESVGVGESLIGTATRHLKGGIPVVLCATVNAVARRWTRKLIDAAHSIDGGKVLIVEMDDGLDLEHLSLSTVTARYYEDRDSALDKLIVALNAYFPNEPEIAAGIPSDGSVDFLDEVTTAATPSVEALAEFRNELREDIAAKYPHSLSAWEFLQRTSLVRGDRLTRVGVLLVGENPVQVIPSAVIECCEYHGTERTAASSKTSILGTLQSQIVQANKYIANRVQRGEAARPTGPYAQPVYAYPMIAVREVIANAVAHRDYSATNACIHIRLFENRIEVTNPGIWTGQETSADEPLKIDSLAGESYRRNFRLASMLTWIRLVEGEGKGILAIAADCLDLGAPIPTVRESAGIITVTIFPPQRRELAAEGEMKSSERLSRTSEGIDVTSLTEQVGQLREVVRSVSASASRTAGQLDVHQVADELAQAVGSQWASEASVRRLNDPYPLSVSWTATGQDLSDSWEVLITLASSGAGWPPPRPSWAAGPDDLAGSGGELADVLSLVPTGRLLVLGDPGAGKTMLMIRLILDLLARRVSSGPVPILVSLASWDPTSQDLHSWLATRLAIDYPALATAVPGRRKGNRIEALLAARLILPILDGLDEIAEPVRGNAIMEINEALSPGMQLVLTSRTVEYAFTVRDGAALRGAVAIELRPLEANAVSQYLRDDALSLRTASRWEPVVATLGTRTPTGQALVTPLMVSLARNIYNPRPGQSHYELPDPAELNDYQRFPTAEAVELYLLNAFISASYSDDSRSRWTARNAKRWLAFLATQLGRSGTREIAWWHLADAVPRTALALMGSFAGVLVGGLAGVLAGWIAGGGAATMGGLAGALAVGMMFGLSLAKPPRYPAAAARWMPSRGITAGIFAGLGAGMGTGLAVGAGPGVAAGLTSAVMLGAAIGLKKISSNRQLTIIPHSMLASDIRTTFTFAIVFTFSGGIVAAVIAWLAVATAAGVCLIGASGFILGMATGIALSGSAWPTWVLARIWLAIKGRLPWRIMAFLADAHHRGVLRQTGAVYQFRHILLQEQLAKQSGTEVISKK